MVQRKPKSETCPRGTDFTPALIFGSPTLEQWSQQFFLTEIQESFDTNGHVVRHTGPMLDDPDRHMAQQLITPVADFEPLFRDVEILGGRSHQAILIEAETDSTGLALLTTEISDLGSGKAEVLVSAIALPLSKLSDVNAGISTMNQIQIRLPETGFVRLGLALRASSTGEPVFAVETANVAFDLLTADQKAAAIARLHALARQVAAVAAQGLMSQGAWPPTPETALADVGALITEKQKKVLVTALIIGGMVGAVGGQALVYFGLGAGGRIALGIGGLSAGSAALVNLWLGGAQPQPDPLPDEEDPLLNQS